MSADRALRVLAEAAAGRHRTAEDHVVAVLRDAIASGVFEPGEHLSQPRLAGVLRVSRMPIRSALRRLESEGMVEFHPHRGASVSMLSVDEVADLYEMRILIESFALRKTVVAVDAARLSELGALADRVGADAAEDGWLEARRRFYRSLYEIGNTPRVVSTVMQFREELSRYSAGVADIRAGIHHELLERVASGDPDLAAAWLEAHLREVVAVLRRSSLRRGEPNERSTE